MTFDQAFLESFPARFAAQEPSPEHLVRRVTKLDLYLSVRALVEQHRAKGYSWDGIAAVFCALDVTMSAATLKRCARRARAKDRADAAAPAKAARRSPARRPMHPSRDPDAPTRVDIGPSTSAAVSAPAPPSLDHVVPVLPVDPRESTGSRTEEAAARVLSQQQPSNDSGSQPKANLRLLPTQQAVLDELEERVTNTAPSSIASEHLPAAQRSSAESSEAVPRSADATGSDTHRSSATSVETQSAPTPSPLPPSSLSPTRPPSRLTEFLQVRGSRKEEASPHPGADTPNGAEDAPPHPKDSRSIPVSALKAASPNVGPNALPGIGWVPRNR